MSLLKTRCFADLANRRRQWTLTLRTVPATAVSRRVKQRLRDAKLPPQISLHSFRVAVATDLLTQDVPLEQVQYLLGHADSRTTNLLPLPPYSC